MKIKYFIVILFILLLSGCKYEYNVEILRDSISETNISYIEDATKRDVKEKTFNTLHKYVGSFDELGIEKYKVVKKDDLYGVAFYREFDMLEYQNSSNFSLCYDNYRISDDKENGKIIISTSKKFNCFDVYDELEEVVVNVSTRYQVISSNADSVNKNKYTWYIDRNNASDKSINLVLNSKEYDEGFLQIGAFEIVLLSILVIGLIVLLVRFIGKKNNKT